MNKQHNRHDNDGENNRLSSSTNSDDMYNEHKVRKQRHLNGKSYQYNEDTHRQKFKKYQSYGKYLNDSSPDGVKLN